LSSLSATPVSIRLSVVPPFPPIATRLLALLSKSSIEVKDLAALISADAMFTGRILQYANSCEFGLLEPVRNIRHALTTLGLDRTRRITITAAMGAYSQVALRTPQLRRCWRHTIATAVLADEISLCCAQFTDSAYAAGIMHDIGRLGLLVAYPAIYEDTVRDAADRSLDLLDYEREVFGLDHTEAGRLLSGKWNLPPELQLIAGRHHDPCEGVELSLLKIVHVSCALADYFDYDVTRPLQPLDFNQLVSILPEPARTQLISAGPDALRHTIAESIRALDSEVEEGDPKNAWKTVRDEFVPEGDGNEPDPEGADADCSHPCEPTPKGLLRRFFSWLIAAVWPTRFPS
jgi:HD-like signal output (HDOD) protein